MHVLCIVRLFLCVQVFGCIKHDKTTAIRSHLTIGQSIYAFNVLPAPFEIVIRNYWFSVENNCKGKEFALELLDFDESIEKETFTRIYSHNLL